MGESTPEGAISPVGSASQSEVRKPPLWRRVLRMTPKEVKTPDVTPAVPATDSVPATQEIDTGISPVNADAPEFATPSAPIDAVASKVDEDLTAQMAAHVSNPFPGAKPPEMAVPSSTLTPTPTETIPSSTMNDEPTRPNIDGLTTPTISETPDVMAATTPTESPTPPDPAERQAA